MLRFKKIVNGVLSVNIPFFIAHRGGNQAPENTLQAFKSAALLGAKMCEFDIQLTQDNELVVIHDETLDRTTHGHGLVRDFNLKEIQALGDGIPNLNEVYLLCQELNLGMNIEIKSFDYFSEDKNPNIKTALCLIQWLKKLKNLNNILISSFDISLLYLVRDAFPSLNLGYLIDIKNFERDWENIKNKIIRETQELSCLSLNLNQDILNTESIKKIRACVKTTLILAYTVNHPERVKFLKSQGIDGVFTDDLSLLGSQ